MLGGILIENQRIHMHPGCQNEMFSIFKEYLGKDIKLKHSENIKEDSEDKDKCSFQLLMGVIAISQEPVRVLI